VRLPSGRTRALPPLADVGALHRALEDLEGIPAVHQRLVAGGVELRRSASLCDLRGRVLELRLRVEGGGGDGDQPDWTERGKVPSGSKKRGPDARAPDWAADPAKKAARHERELRERGELVVAVGPFCVPCGKRFAKQTVYDAHLAGTKHLRALQRMGRTEEAMVCQLDVEANKRRIAELEAARDRERMSEHKVGKETEEERRRKLAEREAKLLEREMMPMPATVCARVVDEDATDEEAEGAATTSTLHVEKPVPLDPAALAIAASGVASSYTGGMQDGAKRVNRFTTDAAAAAHRKLAVPGADWFNPTPKEDEAAAACFPQPKKAA